jgi:FecR protein
MKVKHASRKVIVTSLRWHLLLALTLLLALAHQGASAQTAVVGILEGKATLVRQTAKLALAEGVSLQNEDIVETAAGGFVQIEFSDGGRIGIGPESRLMLAPRGPARGVASGAATGTVATRLYLLQGWVKLNQPADKPAPGDTATPLFELAAVSGATIFMSNPKQFAAFVESGSAKLVVRGGDGPPLQLATGSFFLVRSGEKPSQSARPTADFLEQMPRPFRDPLPSRAGRFRDNPVSPKPLGDVAYDDIAGWLSAEPALRLPMVERWRPRLRDKAFRAAMIANLAAHPEWDPWVFPEKAAKKKADEKRAREAKAAAAAAAAAAASAQAASAAVRTAN